MWFPISISRTSLLALAALGTADRPSVEPPRFRKPAAAVAVRLAAPIYRGRIADSAAVLRALRDTVTTLFRESYRYVAWHDGTGPAPEDTVVFQVQHDVASADNVKLLVAMRGAHAGGDTVIATFEALPDIWGQADWTTAAVLQRWSRHLRAIAADRGVEFVYRILVQLPLDVTLSAVDPRQTTIPIGHGDIGNDRDRNPEFKLEADVVDTDPDTTRDPVDLFLMGCQAGDTLYVCRIKKAVFLGDTIDGEDSVTRELVTPDRSIHARALHIWRYHPDGDTRDTAGMISGGATP